VKLYFHSLATPSWRGAQLKHRDKFTFKYVWIVTYTPPYVFIGKCLSTGTTLHLPFRTGCWGEYVELREIK